jgi:drug/metabolite transporter (DMT)-like permease
MVAIKIGNRGFPPLLAAGIRSTGAALMLFSWAAITGRPIWPNRKMLPHALAVGALFAGEFVFLYLGTTHTSASRAVVLLYTNPLWTALGAHLLLKGDRIGSVKAAGLMLSFGGILAVFAAGGDGLGEGYWKGDLMEVTAAIFWATTTLYAKKIMERFGTTALQVLFYQLAFSAPLLLGLSLVTEMGSQQVVWRLDATLSMIHQTVIVAGLSYLGWFWLMERHRVSSLSSFTFFTPLFGVIFGGLILGEQLPALLWVGLAFVAGGIYLVNRPVSEPLSDHEQADGRGSARAGVGAGGPTADEPGGSSPARGQAAQEGGPAYIPQGAAEVVLPADESRRGPQRR